MIRALKKAAFAGWVKLRAYYGKSLTQTIEKQQWNFATEADYASELVASVAPLLLINRL